MGNIPGKERRLKMIDIHCHILPGIDDGPKDIQKSLVMARMASESGVEVIVATPHSNVPESYQNYNTGKLMDVFLETKRAIEKKKIPLKLLLGMEVYATWDVPRLLAKKKLLTLNGGKYLLIEFAVDENPDFVRALLEKIISQSVIPVIAHPERYSFIQDSPEIITELLKIGCKTQVNKDSVFGVFGEKVKETANTLLRDNQVSAIGSDAHGIRTRTLDYYPIQKYLLKNYSVKQMEKWLKTGPGELCEYESRKNKNIDN